MEQKRYKRPKTFRGYSKKSRALYTTQTVLAVLVTLVMLFPLYWMLISSLRPGEVLLGKSASLLPTGFEWRNYLEAWTRVPLWRYIWNTIAVTAISMTIKIVGGVLAAYGFANGRFPGRDILFYVVLGATMVPHQVTFVPMYVICSRLGWVDTYAGLVFPGIVGAHFIFMMRQSFRSVDQSYIDAGRLDGLGVLGTIWYVMVPMCKASLITMSLTTLIGQWNSYFWPKIIVKTDAARVLTVGLIHLRESWTGTEMWAHTNVTMAGAVIGMLPAIVLFFMFQKYMLTGYSKASMK